MIQYKAFLPALIWLIGITILSTGANVPMPKFNLIGPDKLAHAGAYALLAWLVLYGYQKVSGKPGTKALVYIWLFAAGYGVLMEFVQGAFFPNRFFEFDDMLANAIGALVPVFWSFRRMDH